VVHNVNGKPAEPEAQGTWWGTKIAYKLSFRKNFW